MQNEIDNRQNKINAFYDELRAKHKSGIKCIKTSGASLPYSIYYKDETEAYIQVAVAGYQRNDISVHKKGDVLSVSTSYDSCGLKEAAEPPTEDIHYLFKSVNDDSKSLGNIYYVYKGITNKEFNMNFLIPTGHETSSIDIVNGILTIEFILTDEAWSKAERLF